MSFRLLPDGGFRRRWGAERTAQVRSFRSLLRLGGVVSEIKIRVRGMLRSYFKRRIARAFQFLWGANNAPAHFLRPQRRMQGSRSKMSWTIIRNCARTNVLGFCFSMSEMIKRFRTKSCTERNMYREGGTLISGSSPLLLLETVRAKNAGGRFSHPLENYQRRMCFASAGMYLISAHRPCWVSVGRALHVCRIDRYCDKSDGE
jgi:hypothetical protein